MKSVFSREKFVNISTKTIKSVNNQNVVAETTTKIFDFGIKFKFLRIIENINSFLLQQLQVPPTIVVHGPSVSTQQVGPSGTVVRRRLDLLTENELATISATIGIYY